MPLMAVPARKRPADEPLPLGRPGSPPDGLTLVRALLVSGKGLSLGGGFMQVLLKSGPNLGLERTSTHLRVTERKGDGSIRLVDLPLGIVALEYE